MSYVRLRIFTEAAKSAGVDPTYLKDHLTVPAEESSYKELWKLIYSRARRLYNTDPWCQEGNRREYL